MSRTAVDLRVPASATAEEAAAIVAAIELVWPQPVAPASQVNGRSGTSWRFSGRWWMDQRIQGRPLRLS
ncbi:MAG: hypothetical protein ACERLM_05550 [Acidimicrobiales bacterium]